MRNLCLKFVLSLFILCTWIQTGYAQKQESDPSTYIDGANFIANVWEALDPITSLGVIQGSYVDGTTAPTAVPLSLSASPTHATNPTLKTATNPTATTTAVTAWQAFDTGTSNFIIQVVTATTTIPGVTTPTWNTTPITISDTSGSELPLNIANVDISSDGQLISVIWGAYLFATGETIIHQNISTDGGVTWLTTPYTL